jgi:hypothetical protein
MTDAQCKWAIFRLLTHLQRSKAASVPSSGLMLGFRCLLRFCARNVTLQIEVSP